MDPLERELRDLLTSDRRDLPASLVPLDRVHAGASRRRRRRAAVASAATAVAVLAVAGTAAGAGFLRDDKAPVADSTPTVSRSIVPAPVPTSTAPDTTINAPSGPAWGGAAGSVGHRDQHPHVRRARRARRTPAPARPRTACDWPRAATAGRTFSPLPVPEIGRGAVDGPTTDRPPACGSAAPRTAGCSAAACGPATTAATAGRGVSMPGPVVPAGGGRRHGLGAGADARRRHDLWRSPVGTDDWTQGARASSVTGPADLAVQGDRVVVRGRTGLPALGRRHRRLRRSTRAPAPARLATELSSVGAFWVDLRHRDRRPPCACRRTVPPGPTSRSHRAAARSRTARRSGRGPTTRPWSARASTRRSRGWRPTAR